MSVIDDYMVRYPSVNRPVLLHIRDVILDQYPAATETISYGMPVRKLYGKYLLGFAAFRDHNKYFPEVRSNCRAGERAGRLQAV